MITYTRNGKMHFLRLGRLCFSFVLSSSSFPQAKARKATRKQAWRAGYCTGDARGFSDGRVIGHSHGFRDGYEAGLEAGHRRTVVDYAYGESFAVGAERLSNGTPVLTSTEH